MKLVKLFKEFLKNEDGFFPIIALAALALGTGLQTYGQVKANSASKKAEAAQRSAQETAAARERLRIVREARIRRAEVLQAAENQGAAGSSAAVGAVSSIGTQLQSNLGFLNAERTNNAALSSAQLQANRAGLISGLGGTVAQVGQSVDSYRSYRAQKAKVQTEYDATQDVPF